MHKLQSHRFPKLLAFVYTLKTSPCDYTSTQPALFGIFMRYFFTTTTTAEAVTITTKISDDDGNVHY